MQPHYKKNKTKKFPPNPPARRGGQEGLRTTASASSAPPGRSADGGRRAPVVGRRGRTPGRPRPSPPPNGNGSGRPDWRPSSRRRPRRELAAERAGEADRVAFEAEALAVSAVLDDDQLDAVVKLVRAVLVRPLAQSALPVSRAVVDWCRHAAANHLDSPSLAAAVDAALAGGQGLPSDPAPPLTLATAPRRGMPLRRRVADLMASMVGAVI